ncbi:class I SAM-dependent methyltransferase [Pectinatus sottacetonis]|uniref:class I SAM-dependent methyltransferase n=1 Tax=Pectinatus sottacetonis TaxID=1002795 RepID=UPI0018C852F6|nr:methyltransferase [Pectinatus sottacetonis]
MVNYNIFLREFFEKPTKIGSIIPSSNFLVRKMLQSLSWDEIDSIVELGAGTGVFTKYIAQHKKKNCAAVIIEQNSLMRQSLENHFPKLFFGEQAENLSFILQNLGLKKVDCIISSLPFAMFNKKLREQIIYEVMFSLKKGGKFIAFQYSLQMYPSLHEKFSKIKLDFEILNFPPAFIYRCEKK